MPGEVLNPVRGVRVHAALAARVAAPVAALHEEPLGARLVVGEAALERLEAKDRHAVAAAVLAERAPAAAADVIGLHLAERRALVDRGFPAVRPRPAPGLLAGDLHARVARGDDAVCLHRLRRQRRDDAERLHQKTTATGLRANITANVAVVNVPVVTTFRNSLMVTLLAIAT